MDKLCQVKEAGMRGRAIGLQAPEVEYEMLLLQFAGDVIVTLEEAQDGQVTQVQMIYEMVSRVYAWSHRCGGGRIGKENLDEYATTITDFISNCVQDCVPKKSVQVLPNRKPWMNQDAQSLLKTRCAAFKSGDPDQYRKSRYDLHKAIRAKVLTSFKKTTIIPVPKKAHVTCPNDNCPVAVTLIIMKCFERLVMVHINSSLPTRFDPLQFAYRCNRSTEDAISLALHSSLEYLDNKDTHIRLLLIDYSSAFNTIIPSRLISKLRDLGLSSTLCNWILSFLIHRPQSVRI
eukprot:g32308.t1